MAKPPHGFDINVWRHDMMAAAMILTRIPVPWPEDLTPNTARSYWAFPLVGIAVAVLPVYWGSARGIWPALNGRGGGDCFGHHPLTGGLHQDGFDLRMVLVGAMLNTAFKLCATASAVTAHWP